MIPVVIGFARYLTTLYRIGETQIEVKRGLISRTVLTAPLDRVRSVDLTSPLIHRALGLTKVTVGTGSHDTDLELDALRLTEGRLLETLEAGRLPIHGGDATHVHVTIGLDELRRDLAAADHGLGDNTTRMSASQVRRLACTANLIPVVLGGASEILDLGRSQRLFSRAQRRAMALRDQCCRAEGCSIPATWCEAHHFGRPWAQGGETNLDDGTPQLPNGDIRFARRT